MNENCEVQVSHATTEQFKTTEIGKVPNNNEKGDQFYDDFPELHSQEEDEINARKNSSQAMTTHFCGRSVFYVNTNLKKTNSCICKRIINNGGLLSFKENSTTRKVNLENYAKKIYDNADREMKMVDLVESTAAEGWVYVSAGWSKKERASNVKQNLHRTIELTSFQSNEGFCNEGEEKTCHSREKNNKLQSSTAKRLSHYFLKADRERQEHQRSDKCKLFTVQGTRKLRANTESIVMNISLCDNKFSPTEMKKEANRKVNTKEFRDSVLVAQKKSEKHENKPENLKFGLNLDEYVEMCSKDQPHERKHAEDLYNNNKEVDDNQRRSTEETTENYFCNSENKRFEEGKSLNKLEIVEKVNINMNSEKVVNSSDEVFFRPSPMPRKQTTKPRPKPRTKTSILLPNKSQQRTIRNSPSCVKERECRENVELQPRCPETSNRDEVLTGSKGCSPPNHMKPIPSPRKKSPSTWSPVQFSPQYPSFHNCNSVEDLHEDKTKISLSVSELNTQSTAPPPRPPKTHLLERQTSSDSQPTTSASNCLLKDEDGYLLPVNDCFLPEKLNSKFVCMIESPPLLPRKPVTKKGNFSTPPSESRKAKTLIPDGKLPGSKLFFEPSTMPRPSGIYLFPIFTFTLSFHSYNILKLINNSLS